MLLDIPEEILDVVIENTLRRDRMWCREDLARMKEGVNLRIMSLDQNEDIALCEQRLEAYNILMQWYGQPGTFDDDPT